MTMDDLQPIQIGGDYSLEDLPRSTPIYLYTGAEECYRILAFEKDRFLEANRALVQEYHDRRQPDLDLHQQLDHHHCRPLQQHNLRHQSALHRQRHHQARDLTDYVLFRFPSTSIRDEYLNSEDTPYLSTLSGDLLLLTMITPEHTGAPGRFIDEIDDALSPMGLHRAIKKFVNPEVKPPGEKEAKRGDVGWGPKRPPRGYARNRPTVVLEVGVSEGAAKLRTDAQFWLDPERGQANIVMTCKVDRKKPIVIIETWEPKENRGIRRREHVVLSRESKDSEKVKKTRDSLTIPFVHLFRREPEGPHEKDIVLGEESLEAIARGIWEDQGFFEAEEPLQPFVLLLAFSPTGTLSSMML